MAILMLFTVVATCTQAQSIPLKPYKDIHGGSFKGVSQPLSPDPYNNYKWDLDSLGDPFQYQAYTDLPVSVVSNNAGAFSGLDSLTKPNGLAAINGVGIITVKFKQEAACWIEFDSDNLATSSSEFDMTISENILPGEVWRKHPVQYNTTYRLETNNQLYEGIRYVFINVTQPGHWSMKNLRRICQVVPTNYVGKFESSNPTLTQIWWTGAYTVKVTLVGDGINSKGGYLGSELKDRGDRIAFLGDAHVAQATALVAFGNYKLLNASNEYTKSIGNSIQPYWIMWVDSVLDYYDHTGDKASLLSLSPWIEQRLDYGDVVATSGTQVPLDWSRDDDRMGFGFEDADRPEGRRAFIALLVGAADRYAKVAASELNNHTKATKYSALADKWRLHMRSQKDWFSEYGLHAACDAINSGVVNKSEAAIMLGPGGVFDDPLQLPSLSNFESYFVLKALMKIGASEQGSYLIHRHWAGMLALGATTTWERFDPQWVDSGCLDINYPPVNAMNQDTSMAHPWASGATAILSKHALGVSPTSPGFTRFKVVPVLLDNRSMHWVRGEVPTPHGAIKININLRHGFFKIVVPVNTFADHVAIPILNTGLVRVALKQGVDDNNVTVIWANTSDNQQQQRQQQRRQQLPQPQQQQQHQQQHHHQQQQQQPRPQHQQSLTQFSVNFDSKYFYVMGLSSGTFEFEYSYTVPATPSNLHAANDIADAGNSGKWNPNSTNFSYAATLVGLDHTTGGSWVGTYGSKGYVLFNYTNGDDVVQLPSGIQNVWAASDKNVTGGPPYPTGRDSCPNRHGWGACVDVWNNSTLDASVLENPNGKTLPRTAVGLTSSRWASFHVDIVSIAESAPQYNVTLYMVDYERAYIRQAIKARDGRSLKTIAPMVLVDDFSGGVYVTYTYSGSMFFRFIEVPSERGLKLGFPPRPTISGLFFD